MVATLPLINLKEDGIWCTFASVKSCWGSAFCFEGSETSYITPFLTFLAPTSLPGLMYALSSKLIIRLLALFSSLNMSSLQLRICALWWWVARPSSVSVLGGFLEQNRDFPQCAFAALEFIFFGLLLLSTVVADLISFLPRLCKL